MSSFFSKKYAALIPYTPGEQPRERKFIKLNTNESPFPPSPLAVKMGNEANQSLNLYCDPTCKKLTDAAEKVLGLGADRILFTNGSDEILNFAFMAFCDSDTPAVFADITYGFYRVFADLNGVKYREIPLNRNFEIAPEEYYNAGGTVFIANPNAPTGLALSKSQIEKIIINNPDNVVVIDEAYVDFGGESCIDLIDKYPNLLVTRTFSKSRSLAGARLGFGAACPELIQDLNTIKYSTNPYNVNSTTMAAGAGALLDTGYFEKTVGEVKEARVFTCAELKKRGFTFPESSTNFVFAKHPSIGGQRLYTLLREKGILVRHFETDRLKDYNRITIGSRSEMEAFIKAIDEITEETK